MSITLLAYSNYRCMCFMSGSLSFLELSAVEKTEAEEKNEIPALVWPLHTCALTEALTWEHIHSIFMSPVWSFRAQGTDAFGADYAKEPAQKRNALRPYILFVVLSTVTRCLRMTTLRRNVFWLIVSEDFLHDCSSQFEHNIMEGGICCHREIYSSWHQKKRVKGLETRFTFKGQSLTTHFLQMGQPLRFPGPFKAVPPAGE